MKQLVTFFSITLFCFTNHISFGQFTNKDFIITTKGLSDEYSSRFKESSKKDILADMFNQLNITHVIAPIKVRVIYENNVGNVIAEINYDHDKIFTENTEYRSHNLNLTNFGKGISIYLQNQIFNALSQYKKTVATNNDYSIDEDLIKFESIVKLKKVNGDWVNFYAFNYLDSRGLYPSTIYKNVHINIGGKTYEAETIDVNMLNSMNFFFVGKSTSIDGSKTGTYYFCKFFNIETE